MINYRESLKSVTDITPWQNAPSLICHYSGEARSSCWDIFYERRAILQA
jgi:hypothetical protein